MDDLCLESPARVSLPLRRICRGLPRLDQTETENAKGTPSGGQRQCGPGKAQNSSWVQCPKLSMVGHVDCAKKLEALRSVKVQDHDWSLYSIQVGSSESLTIINLGRRDVFEQVVLRKLLRACELLRIYDYR